MIVSNSTPISNLLHIKHVHLLQKLFGQVYIPTAVADELNRPLKFSQLLRHVKKFKLLRMSKYAATLNFFCSLHLGFLNGLFNKVFFNRLLMFILKALTNFKIV